MYTIKQVAERLKCNPNVIRFYEKKGLIFPSREENGYRKYSNGDIEQLQFIILYRQLGFSVDAIKRICVHGQRSKLDIFANQYNIVNQQIHSLLKIREVLGEAIDELLDRNEISNRIHEKIEETIYQINEANQWNDNWEFDSWASNYDNDIRKDGAGLAFYKNYDRVMDSTAAEVTKIPGNIVEIGIGTGNLTMKILEKYAGIDNNLDIRVIGIDQSVNMLKEAKRKLPQIAMRLGTFLKLPIEECSCDTVVSSYAFHHCNSKEKELAIKEMNRILKPGGRIIITDLMFRNQAARDEYEKTSSIRELEDLADEYFANVDEVEEILSAYGFETKYKQIDSLIWMVIGTKLNGELLN